jgi:hypothetical protein
VGIIALIYQGVSWTARKTAGNSGSTRVAAEEPHTIRPLLIIAGIALGCGTLLFLSARKDAGSPLQIPKKQI